MSKQISGLLDAYFDAAYQEGINFYALPDDYCDAVDLPRGTICRQENVALEQVIAIAHKVRAATLEEAAVKCEQIDFSYSACEQFVSGESALECATAIRGLKHD